MKQYKLKENIVLDSYNNSKNMKSKILSFIYNGETDKILYKGNPQQIDYKLLRKILPSKEENNIKELDLSDDNLRTAFTKFMEKTKSKYCLVYKKD